MKELHNVACVVDGCVHNYALQFDDLDNFVHKVRAAVPRRVPAKALRRPLTLVHPLVACMRRLQCLGSGGLFRDRRRRSRGRGRGAQEVARRRSLGHRAYGHSGRGRSLHAPSHVPPLAVSPCASLRFLLTAAIAAFTAAAAAAAVQLWAHMRGRFLSCAQTSPAPLASASATDIRSTTCAVTSALLQTLTRLVASALWA